MSGGWGIAEAVFAAIGIFAAGALAAVLLLLAFTHLEGPGEARAKPGPGDLHDGRPLDEDERRIWDAVTAGDIHEGDYSEGGGL